MKLLSPEELNAYVEGLIGPGFAADIRAAAACIDPKRLREVTPIAWDSTPFPDTVEL